MKPMFRRSHFSRLSVPRSSSLLSLISLIGRRLKLLCALIVCLCLTAASTSLLAADRFGQKQAIPFHTLNLSVVKDRISLSPHLVYWVDRQDLTTPEQVFSKTIKSDWLEVVGDVANFGYESDPHWFAVELYQPTKDETWNLVFEYPVLDRIELFTSSNNAEWQHLPLGDQLPFAQRPMNHNLFVVPIHLKAGEKLRLLVRVATGTSMQIPISLWNPDKFQEYTAFVNMGQGVYFGFMLVMSLYNLFLYFSIREPRYLYYVGFIASVSLFQLSINGYGYQYIWSSLVRWNELSLPVALSGVLVFEALFVRDFLELKRGYHRSDQFLVGIALLAGIVGLLSGVLTYKTSIITLIFISLPLNLSAVVLGFQRWSEGAKDAKYFTMAWLATFLGSIFLALNKIDIIPRNVFTENIASFGTAVEVALISFALGEYINRQRAERFQAQAESLRLETLTRHQQEEALAKQEELTAALEASVKERTQDLEFALQQLSEANQRLQESSQIDELTQLYNRRYFNSRFRNEYERACREQTSLALVMVDVDYFKLINDRYGHLVGDDCLARVAAVLKQHCRRPADMAARFGGEEFVLVLPQTSAQGAQYLAETIRIAISHLRIDVEGAEPIEITVSLGCTARKCFREIAPEALIAEADNALYQAKAGGRNRVEAALCG